MPGGPAIDREWHSCHNGTHAISCCCCRSRIDATMTTAMNRIAEFRAADEPGPAQRRKDAQRRRIFAAAVSLYEENGGEEGGGLEATTVEAIAERSDISVRTFFRYFETKADAIYLDLGGAMDDHIALDEAVAGRPDAGRSDPRCIDDPNDRHPERSRRRCPTAPIHDVEALCRTQRPVPATLAQRTGPHGPAVRARPARPACGCPSNRDLLPRRA